MLLLFFLQANRLEEKLRNELLIGRPEADVERFIQLLQCSNKCDFKLFRQYLKVRANFFYF